MGHRVGNVVQWRGQDREFFVLYLQLLCKFVIFFSNNQTKDDCFHQKHWLIYIDKGWKKLLWDFLGFITMMPLVTLLRTDSAEQRDNRQRWIERCWGGWKGEIVNIGSPHTHPKRFVICENERGAGCNLGILICRKGFFGKFVYLLEGEAYASSY